MKRDLGCLSAGAAARYTSDATSDGGDPHMLAIVHACAIIGLDGYVLPMADLVGDVADRTGTKFDDRIALGAYPADIHPIVGREFPKYIHAFHDTLPFYIPFRALTNERIENMLVAGKTMAQSFMANSATRLHPTEWSTGTAAGVAAAYMAKTGKTARQALESVAEVQKLVKAKTPIDWTIPADAYTAK
jgi:hypothetical protein